MSEPGAADPNFNYGQVAKPDPKDVDLQYLVRSVVLALRKSHPAVLADDAVRVPLMLARLQVDRLAHKGRCRSGRSPHGHEPEPSNKEV